MPRLFVIGSWTAMVLACAVLPWVIEPNTRGWMLRFTGPPVVAGLTFFFVRALRTRHVVSETGFSTWLWCGPGRPYRLWKRIAWKDVASVGLYDLGRLGPVQVLVYGRHAPGEAVIGYPSFSDSGLDATRYMLSRIRHDAASPSVRAYVEARKIA